MERIDSYRPGKRFWNGLSYAGLMTLLFFAPFERLTPIISIPGQKVTNVEMLLFLALVSWAAGCWMGGRVPRLKTGLTLPAACLLGVMALSALLASGYQSEALRFTARFGAGFLAHLLVVNAITSWRRQLGLAMVCAGAGTCVSLVGILDSLRVAPVLEWLRAYRPTEAWVGAQMRISSTLQYPTITSMYLEIVFGLALGLLLAAVQKRNWSWVLPIFAALSLMGGCIILTLTRAGLVCLAAALFLAASSWLFRRGADRGFWALVVLALVIAALLGGTLWSNSEYWLRLTTRNQLDWYRAEYDVPALLRFEPGQLRKVRVTITNTGRATWHPGGPTPFRLAYHWLADKEQVVIDYEGLRTDLPASVASGRSLSLQARVKAPSRPGRYRLAWDLLQERRFWFSVENSPSALTRVEVNGTASKEAPPETFPIPHPRLIPDRATLWRAAARMLWTRPLLGVGPDNFRLLYQDSLDLPLGDRRYHTHNLYVEFFVCTGLIGGVVFIWLLWRVVANLLGQWKESPGERLPQLIGVSTAVLVVFVHGFFDYFLEFTPTYLMIWTTFGLAVSRPGAGQEQEKHADRV
ncbi:MAG: O-antigen ligase family protein [Acidobacteriota bacterium]